MPISLQDARWTVTSFGLERRLESLPSGENLLLIYLDRLWLVAQSGQGFGTGHYLRKPSLYPAELRDRSPAGSRGHLKAPYQSCRVIASLRSELFRAEASRG
jgi:hypothetical protein